MSVVEKLIDRFVSGYARCLTHTLKSLITPSRETQCGQLKMFDTVTEIADNRRCKISRARSAL
jgi:hypothetical protein